MATQSVRLPKLSLTMEEADVVEWHVQVGDEVTREDDIVTIQTDKVDTVVVSPFSGIIAEIYYSEGQTCPVGEVICTIEARD